MLLKILANDFWSRTNNEIHSSRVISNQIQKKKIESSYKCSNKLINLIYKMTDCLYIIELL